jgi:hypothetical protein
MKSISTHSSPEGQLWLPDGSTFSRHPPVPDDHGIDHDAENVGPVGGAGEAGVGIDLDPMKRAFTMEVLC